MATNMGAWGRLPGRGGCLSFLSVEREVSKQTGEGMVFQEAKQKQRSWKTEAQRGGGSEGSELPRLE